MELEKAIQKINELLRDNNITAEYAMNQVGYKKTKFNILIKDKYKYNRAKRQYEVIGEPQREVIKESNVIPPVKENKTTEGVILTLEQQQKIIELLEDNDTLDLKIEIPLEIKKDYKVTVRTNEKVWKKFNNYCKKKKYYSQKDHLSRALLFYMKHNK